MLIKFDVKRNDRNYLTGNVFTMVPWNFQSKKPGNLKKYIFKGLFQNLAHV